MTRRRYFMSKADQAKSENNAVRSHMFLSKIEELTKFSADELRVECMDIPESPEKQFWVFHVQQDVRVHWLFDRATQQTKITVEYPSFRDGHFVETECRNAVEAAQIFEFATCVLIDLREQLDEII